MRSILVVMLSMLVAGAAQAAKVPPRVEITYDVTIGSVKIGEGRDRFQHDGKTYKVISESETAGVAALIYPLNVHRESSGRVTAKGLRPDTFAELRNGKPKRSARFDWDKRQAVLLDGENEQTVPLPDHTWDTTSFAYNFAFAALDSALAVYLTDGRRISPHEYAVVGKEKLDTELGPLETVHMRKVQKPGDPRGFEVWIAPGHYNLPVRLRFNEKDGTTFDSVVAKISYPDQ
jgi:hypothetical protein